MTDQEVLAEMIAGLPEVRVRPMMGEYVLYCKDKVVGVICVNRLYLKITPASQRFLAGAPEVPPYVGAKPYFLVEDTGNKAWLAEALFAISDELPAPRKRR